jgi:hypothetical protein
MVVLMVQTQFPERHIVAMLSAIVVALLPWRLKRFIYVRLYHWKISAGAHIGFSFVNVKHLVMESGARIGHLNIIRNCELVRLDERAEIGVLNWINGWPLDRTGIYCRETNRAPEFHLGRHAAVTMMHMIDCTDRVSLGPFSLLAGCQSTIYTHSVDLKESRQACAPVRIGAYTFVGTGCTILPGAGLPDYSVLAAKGLLRTDYSTSYSMYAGVPATQVKILRSDLAYFHRTTGALWTDVEGNA